MTLAGLWASSRLQIELVIVEKANHRVFERAIKSRLNVHYEKERIKF